MWIWMQFNKLYSSLLSFHGLGTADAQLLGWLQLNWYTVFFSFNSIVTEISNFKRTTTYNIVVASESQSQGTVDIYAGCLVLLAYLEVLHVLCVVQAAVEASGSGDQHIT